MYAVIDSQTNQYFSHNGAVILFDSIDQAVTIAQQFCGYAMARMMTDSPVRPVSANLGRISEVIGFKNALQIEEWNYETTAAVTVLFTDLQK